MLRPFQLYQHFPEFILPKGKISDCGMAVYRVTAAVPHIAGKGGCTRIGLLQGCCYLRILRQGTSHPAV